MKKDKYPKRTFIYFSFEKSQEAAIGGLWCYIVYFSVALLQQSYFTIWLGVSFAAYTSFFFINMHIHKIIHNCVSGVFETNAYNRNFKTRNSD